MIIILCDIRRHFLLQKEDRYIFDTHDAFSWYYYDIYIYFPFSCRAKEAGVIGAILYEKDFYLLLSVRRRRFMALPYAMPLRHMIYTYYYWYAIDIIIYAHLLFFFLSSSALSYARCCRADKDIITVFLLRVRLLLLLLAIFILQRAASAFLAFSPLFIITPFPSFPPRYAAIIIIIIFSPYDISIFAASAFYFRFRFCLSSRYARRYVHAARPYRRLRRCFSVCLYAAAEAMPLFSPWKIFWYYLCRFLCRFQRERGEDAFYMI